MRPAASSARSSSAPGERRAHQPASLAERLDRLDREASGLRLHADAGAHAARGRTSASQRPSPRSSSSSTSPAPPLGRRTATRARSTRLLLTTTRSAGSSRSTRSPKRRCSIVPSPRWTSRREPSRLLGGPLRDQLLGQRVVELVGAHRRQSRRRPGSPGERVRVIGAATDEVLVRRAAAGGREEFDELVRRHRARVYALALRICRNPDDAEDALQETFIAAYRALPRFDRRARVSTWLYRIATNKCYDVGRPPAPDGRHGLAAGARRPPRPVRAQRAQHRCSRARSTRCPSSSARRRSCATSAG